MSLEITLFRDWSLLYCEMAYSMFTESFRRKYNWEYKTSLFHFDLEKVTIYRDTNEHQGEFFELIKNKIKLNKNFIPKLVKKLYKDLDDFKNFSERINESTLNKMDDKEIIILFKKFYKKVVKCGPDFLVVRYFPVFLDELSIKDFKLEFETCLEARKNTEYVLSPIADKISIIFAKEFLKRNNYNIEYVKYVSQSNLYNWNLNDIALRKKGFIYYNGNFYYNNFEKFTKERNISIKNEISKNDVLKGKIAYGNCIVEGVVRIVKNKSQILDLQKNEILVTTATIPEYVSFLSKAKAILTEEGGITTHAAIVSRELKIPCLIGIKNITKILNNGDLIEVDADKGIVRKIE
jgi:phosphohistidine swiveling domain-containing protein